MSGTQELNRYNMGFPQSEQNALPNTIASAATIAPRHIFTNVTGTVQIDTITPPEPGYHQVILRFTNANPVPFGTGGNVAIAYDPQQNTPIIMHYDPTTGKYYPNAVV